MLWEVVVVDGCDAGLSRIDEASNEASNGSTTDAVPVPVPVLVPEDEVTPVVVGCP